MNVIEISAQPRGAKCLSAAPLVRLNASTIVTEARTPDSTLTRIGCLVSPKDVAQPARSSAICAGDRLRTIGAISRHQRRLALLDTA